MLGDNRGVHACRDDLVVWYGRVGSRDKGLHIGMVSGFTLFGKYKVDLVRIGSDDEIRTTGVVATVRQHNMIVVNDIPESPYE